MLWGRFLVLPLALSMCVGVTDHISADYDGEVDMMTGEAVTETDEGEENSRYVTIPMGSSGTYAVYDMKENVYQYTCQGCHNTVISTVADGMITNARVRVAHENGEPLKLYRNGKEVDNANLNNISAPGKYAVIVKDVYVEHTILSFSIVGKKTSDYVSCKLPDGFDFVQVIYNGEKVTLQDMNKVDLRQDGFYEMTYRCIAAGTRYHLEMDVDHTPPVFTLDGVANSYANGPVTIVDKEKSDKITVMRDGETISTPADGVLTAPGLYTVIVTDEAGNSVTEEFKLRFYLNIQGWIFVLLIAVTAVGVIVFMQYAKKALRVR